MLASAAGAQELTALYGAMRATQQGESSFSFQVDYRQVFHRNFSASISYLNEGHVTGHHRDGTAWQAWTRLPLLEQHVALDVGAGAYYFYDTQYRPGGGTANLHEAAALYSFSATAYLPHRWFARLLVNRVDPGPDLRVTTAALGVGYWFGRGQRPLAGRLGDAPGDKADVTWNELAVFSGQSVVNTFASESAIAGAAEYRRGLWRHVDGTLGYVYEGDPKIIRRSGVAPQVWAVNTFFRDRVSVGFGVGPYVFLDHKHPAVRRNRNPAALAPMVSLTAALHFHTHWCVRLLFHRVTSDYNRDSDVFLLGLGYRWPH